MARALAGVLHFDRGTELHRRALEEAEHAARNGLNDSLDLLTTYLKSTLARIESVYKRFEIATSIFGDEYIEVLDILVDIDQLVVKSRARRGEREQIYNDILLEKENELAVLGRFALKLRQIEALARRTEAGTASLPKEKGAGDVWLAQCIEEALSRKSSDSRFEVTYQPKYECRDGKSICVGAEALTRMHVGSNPISPGLFIAVAEFNGLIGGIGEMVLQETLDLLVRYPELPPISVNVSPYELLSEDYSERVLNRINSAIPGQFSRIELEITEAAVIEDGRPLDHIIRLSDAGVRVAIDDFGTGQTRFDYLAKFKTNVLKIDQSLVRRVRLDPAGYSRLVESIVAIGNVFHLDVIAEGVADLKDLELVSEAKVTQFQGWHFSKAVSADEFVRLVGVGAGA